MEDDDNFEMKEIVVARTFEQNLGDQEPFVLLSS